MSDVDKKLRELIIDKFMGTSRTVIANYSVNDETGEKGSIVTPKQQDIIKSPTKNLEQDEVEEQDEQYDYEEQEEQDEVEETYDYLADSPLSREFVLDSTKIETPHLSMCLYRMNRDGKKPFLEFFCKKENSMYSFPITELNIEQMKTFLPTQELAAVAVPAALAAVPLATVETKEPLQEEVPPPTEEKPIEEELKQEETPPAEEAPIQPTEEEAPIQPTEEEPIQPIEEEAPIQPTEEEPNQPIEEEAPIQPTEEEAPIQPTEEEPIQPIEEEPIQPTEEEPIQPTEEEAPIQPTEEEAPIQPTEEEAPIQPIEEEDLAVEDKQVQQEEEEQAPKLAPLQQGGEEYDEITNLFFEQCSQYFQKITGLSGETASDKYKGYISLADNKHIAVFDMSDLEMEPQEDSIWATLYEINDKKHILDIPVAEFTHKTFSENPVMKYIINQNGAAIDIPIVVYICQENSGSYDNSYYSEEESREQNESIINYRVSHSVLGYCFLFTTEPFEHNNLSKIKRFSLFTIDTIYLINKDRDLSEYQDLDLHDYEILCFYENSVEYWAVDSSDQFLEL
jgi:hypothetical protein